ncbi:MAG: FG-GAP repeat domain-containing protein [Planctomycetota bacterium]|jgi:hypothetical protein
MRKKIAITGTLLILVLVNTACTQSKSAKLDFKIHTINAESKFEVAAAFDVDNDGKIDIFSGNTWYQAPDWKKHFVRKIQMKRNYYFDFCNAPLDVDGDGFTDVITTAWHNKTIAWIKNPGKTAGPFQYIVIDKPGNMEPCILIDINGDKQLDVIPMIAKAAAWFEFKRDKKAQHGVKWIKHQLPKQIAGHGTGAGDINGDGLCDVVGHKGWAQQTKDPQKTWIFHPDFELGKTSIPIQVYDVDGDNDKDLIYGIGHDYGLYWMEQQNKDGKRNWIKHEIDKSWSQVHNLLLADLDGDTKMEIITGKRYYAHNGKDPGANDPICVYYYKYHKATRKWIRATISEGAKVGFGQHSNIVDIDKDGDLDIVAPGKSGLYMIENLLKK